MPTPLPPHHPILFPVCKNKILIGNELWMYTLVLAKLLHGTHRSSGDQPEPISISFGISMAVLFERHASVSTVASISEDYLILLVIIVS